MLLHRHGDALLRVKGILNVANAAAPVAVHGVRRPIRQSRNRAVLIAIGIDWDGRLQVLAVEFANRESRSNWRDFRLP